MTYPEDVFTYSFISPDLMASVMSPLSKERYAAASSSVK